MYDKELDVFTLACRCMGVVACWVFGPVSVDLKTPTGVCMLKGEYSFLSADCGMCFVFFPA